MRSPAWKQKRKPSGGGYLMPCADDSGTRLNMLCIIWREKEDRGFARTKPMPGQCLDNKRNHNTTLCGVRWKGVGSRIFPCPSIEMCRRGNKITAFPHVCSLRMTKKEKLLDQQLFWPMLVQKYEWAQFEMAGKSSGGKLRYNQASGYYLSSISGKCDI